MDPKWAKRFELLSGFFWMAIVGVFFLFVAIFASGWLNVVLLVVGGLLFIPAFVYGYVVIQWHWKDRYRGRHSDLWGAILLLETSGWMKLVYAFRHIMPDIRNTGRYHRMPTPASPPPFSVEQ